MAGIGIGLGGFMDGFTRGMDARAAMDDRKRNKVLQERQDAEYNRVVGQRNEIDAINSGARAEFDKRVSAGTEKPDNFDQFWSGYALPKLKNTYLSQGNMEMADKVQAWGESEDAKAGAKFAMSALTKAQTGDVAGALADATEAGKRKGYISHGFEIKGQDTIVDQNGKLQGYRLYMKGPDGKDIQQDLPLGQVPKMIATYLNPEAAWQTQVEAQAAETKRQQELQDYRAKKGIDQEFGTGSNQKKARSDAIETLRKRMDGGLAGDETKFDDLPREEQERLIATETELQAGQPGTGVPQQPGSQRSGRKVLVDKATGQPVPPPSSQRSAAAPSASPSAGTDRATPGQSPAPTGKDNVRAPGIVDRFTRGISREMNILSGREEAPSRTMSESQKRFLFGKAADPDFDAREQMGINLRPQHGSLRDRSAPQQSGNDEVSSLIQESDAAISDGQQPERVAEGLLQNGIPKEQWPTSLREALGRIDIHRIHIMAAMR
ncbi:MAG: hypothetical protein DI528_12880 [Shinella sp.]|nr:MAG: hypothetical protein DI528_12880 [Shinella sp.]